MTAADGSQVPSQATSGYTQETSEEVPTAHPEFMRSGAPISDPGEALRNPYAAEVNRLQTFLMTAYPQEMARTNVVKAESPVDVAIRLLRGLGASAPVARCSDQYCNLPANHDGSHGFVNYDPR